MSTLQETSENLLSFCGDKRYSTIYADPPWRFQNRTGKVAPENKKLNRYETMSLADIMALPVEQGKEAKESVQEVFNYSGIYLSYSLSSSTDSLKIEPYMICASENNEYVKVGMINAYKSVHWGSGIISNHQNSYLMFNERDLPQFALVTIYLQLPHYEFPNMLKGLYLCLDYNHNPIARRIVLVKQSDCTDVHKFLEMEGGLVPKAELTPELEVYYNYTCQEGDYIKTCTVPSPKLDETDLEREKKMLKI